MGTDSAREGFLAHWSFESQIVRVMPWEDLETVKTLILDPSMDKFTVLTLTGLPETDDEALIDPITTEPSRNPAALTYLTNYYPNTETHVETFELDDKSGTFKPTSRQTRRMLLRHGKGVNRCSIRPGQLCLIDEIKHWFGEETDSNNARYELNERHMLGFPHPFDHRLCSLEKGQGFVINRAVTIQNPECDEGFDFISPSPEVFYLSWSHSVDYGADKASIMRPYSPDFSPVYQRLYESTDQLRDGVGARIFGDGDFMVFVKRFKVCIRSFNERNVWDPSQINWPGEVKYLGLSTTQIGRV